jgi:predicted RNA-binding Zn ribbon-like protein
MSSRLVDGVTIPNLVANHPALDFCNTRAAWPSAHPKEYLRAPKVLPVWSREAGLISADDADRLIELSGADEAGARSALDRALNLREALYPVFLGAGTPAQWALVAAEAEQARAASRLVPGAHPGAAATWEPSFLGPGTVRLDSAVLAVAQSAADFLTGRLVSTVGACPRPDCGWLFTDPRGRRRWCSMAVCGNRVKASRHRGNRYTKESESGGLGHSTA